MLPKLRLESDGQSVVVTCTHEGHLQLADLRLSLFAAEEGTMTISPTGTLSEDKSVLARRELLLTRTGINPIELMRIELPRDEWQGMELRATLINPGSQGQHSFTRASLTETLKLP